MASAIITIYHPSGSQMQVTQNDYDTYWKGQGWSASALAPQSPVQQPVSQSAPQPVQQSTAPAPTQQATQAPAGTTAYYSPTGEIKYMTPSERMFSSGSWSSSPPVTSQPQQQTTSPITDLFKSGLSQTQQQSILNLLKKSVETWNDIDRRNWSYATNNTNVPANRQEQERLLLGSIQSDQGYNPSIEEEVRQYFPETEFGQFQGYFYTTQDEQAGKIPAGKKVGDLTEEGAVQRQQAEAQYQPFYEREYQDVIGKKTTEESRLREDTARIGGEEAVEYGAEKEKEARDYGETLRQYKRSFSGRGMTFSGEAQRTLGTQSAPGSNQPGLVELDRAYNLGKFERQYERGVQGRERTLTRNIEDINREREMADRARKEGLETNVQEAIQQREQEAYNRYQTDLFRHEATARRPSGSSLY